MTPIIQNVIWCVVGVFGGLIIAKLIRTKTPQSQEPTAIKKTLQPVKEEKTKQYRDDQPIDVIRHPEGSAKDAFIANVKNLTPLFEALNKGDKFSEVVNDAIIEINNNELMNIWVKICKDPKAIIRIFASWGLRCEDEVKFQPQKHHFERYNLNNGQSITEGKNYKVLSPCWIYTFIDKDGATHKDVIIKGEAAEI